MTNINTGLVEINKQFHANISPASSKIKLVSSEKTSSMKNFAIENYHHGHHYTNYLPFFNTIEYFVERKALA